MKLTYFFPFSSAGWTHGGAVALALSGAQAATSLPAAEYAPRSGADAGEMTIARMRTAIFRRQLSEITTTGLVVYGNKYPSTTMWDASIGRR